MHEARKRRIHERERGVCWWCGKPVPQTGPGVRYDHKGTLFITQSDDDATIFPIHTEPCDKEKTYGAGTGGTGDIGRIAKTKRQMAMSLDVPRPPPKMKSGRGFAAVHRPLKSRNDLRKRKP